MIRRFTLLMLIASLLILSVGCSGTKKAESNYNDDKFKVGQVWHYENRPNEDNSTITVLKVENYENLGIVIHIAIDNLSIKDKEGKLHDTIGHLPYSKEALNKSVTALIKENESLPDFKEGYDSWKTAFDAKQAGIWTVPVADAVKCMEEVLSK